MLKTIHKKLKFFRSYDIFGYPISLSFKQKNTYTTIFGGIFSIIVISLFLSIFIYSFYKLFNQEYKETNKYIRNLFTHQNPLQLNTENFMLAMRFDGILLNNWEKKYIDISVFEIKQIRNSTHTWKVKREIQTNKCDKSFFTGLEDEFDQLQLNNSLCISKDSKFSIEGDYQESLFSYLYLELKACNNTEICQTPETINKLLLSLDKIRFQMFIINNYINELDIQNPIKRKIVSDIHFLVDPIKDVFRTADIYLSETEVQTDLGFIPTMFNTKKSIQNFTFMGEIREQTIFSSTKARIAEFYFRKSQTKYVFERKLGNLLTILSYLGGIWSSIYFIVFILMTSYTKYSFINHLANKIYQYPSQIKRRIKLREKTESNNISNNNGSPIFMMKLQNYLNYDRKLFINFFKMLKILLFSLFSFKSTDEKIILFKKSKSKLMNDLDIINILKRLQELEKLKRLLFTDDQRIILNFFPKPAISPDNLYYVTKTQLLTNSSNRKTLKRLANQKKFASISNKNKCEDINYFQKLIDSWKNIKMQENLSDINKKLVDYLSQKFSQIIDINELDLKSLLTEKINTFSLEQKKDKKEKKENNIKRKHSSIQITDFNIQTKSKMNKSIDECYISENLSEKNEELYIKSSRSVNFITEKH